MIRPLKDYVLLEVEPAERNIGGFIVPESKDKPSVAKVVAVGPGKEVDGKIVAPTAVSYTHLTLPTILLV